jgi:ABC-type nitrate/sulfonate/bicarbonate transport system permease component
MTSVRRFATAMAMVTALPIALFVTWWVLTANSTSFYWPPLSEILGVFPETWFEGRLTEQVLPSLLRLAAGYALALVVGIGLGVAIGSSRVLRSLLEPVLEFFRAIPPPVLVPILILFAGIGTSMKVLVIFSGCVWPILLNTVEGVRGIDEVLRDTARCYRLRTGTRLRSLVLRAASPQIAAGARQALSVGVILMVISEMFAANNGLGFTIVQFQRSFAIPEMWSGILLLGLIGVGLSLLFRILEHRVLAWYRGQREIEREG